MESYGSFLAAGDVFLTRGLPENGYEGLDPLSALIRKHDVRFANLEVTVHGREGYPFGFSGGTWAMAAPALLDDLKRFGFNVYNAANNHSMDYSHNGLLATVRHLREHGLRYAGIGENLADAAAPVYVEAPGIRAALVAATSTFHESWAAGSQRPDMQGRPGVNPLRFRTEYHVRESDYAALERIAREVGINAQHNLDVREGFAAETPGILNFGGHEFVRDVAARKETSPSETDLARITKSVREAKKQSDFVMVSIHSHEMEGESKDRPAEFLKRFARACVDAGASAVIGHGPHILRGIECYRGGVIFYSLGNFLFENDTTTHQPADFYEKYGLSDTDLVGTGMETRSRGGTVGLGVNPDVWRSVVAEWDVRGGRLGPIRLYPVDLGQSLPPYRRGLPSLAEEDETLFRLQALSEEFGTNIRIENHVGVIQPNTEKE